MWNRQVLCARSLKTRSIALCRWSVFPLPDQIESIRAKLEEVLLRLEDLYAAYLADPTPEASSQMRQAFIDEMSKLGLADHAASMQRLEASRAFDETPAGVAHLRAKVFDLQGAKVEAFFEYELAKSLILRMGGWSHEMLALRINDIEERQLELLSELELGQGLLKLARAIATRQEKEEFARPSYLFFRTLCLALAGDREGVAAGLLEIARACSEAQGPQRLIVRSVRLGLDKYGKWIREVCDPSLYDETVRQVRERAV